MQKTRTHYFNTILILYYFWLFSNFQPIYNEVSMHSKVTLFTFNAHAQWLVLLYNSSEHVLPKTVKVNFSKNNHLLYLWIDIRNPNYFFSLSNQLCSGNTYISWCNLLPKVKIKFVLNILSEKHQLYNLFCIDLPPFLSNIQ